MVAHEIFFSVIILIGIYKSKIKALHDYGAHLMAISNRTIGREWYQQFLRVL